MSDQEIKKETIDRRSMIKTLGTAAATAAIVGANAPQVLAASLPPAAPAEPQAQAKKEGGSSSKILGGKYMADFFNAYGVTAIFWMPAVMNRTLANMEMQGYPIKRVLPHGEKAAAYMADGYARVSGRPGICGCQAVGAANLAAGLRDAYMAHSPVIAIAGSPGPTEKYKYPYQMRPDDYPTFNQYTKANYQVDIPERLPDLLRQAFREATSETPGPVSLLLPGNSGNLDNQLAELELVVEKQYTRVPSHRTPPEMDAVKEAAKVLRGAQRPVLVVDVGARWSGARAEVLKLAEMLNMPIATALHAYSLVPNNHPLYIGVPGSYSRASANKTLARADMVLFVGSQAAGQETDSGRLPPEGTTVIQIGIDPTDLGRTYPNAVSLLGDPKLTLQALIEQVGPNMQRDAWVAEAKANVAAYVADESPYRNSDASPIRPERMAKELGDAMPSDTIVFCDTGHQALWCAQELWSNSPNWDFMPCAGSLGWSFSASLGAKCALPNRPVACFVGDGGFYYHMQEVETAVRCGINTVTLVNNNHALSQEIGGFRQGYGGKPGPHWTDLWQYSPKVDLAKFAESMGALGIRVEKPSELRAAIDRGFSSGRPTVIDIQTDVDAFPAATWHS